MVVSLSATLTGALGFAHTLSLFANKCLLTTHLIFHYWEVELWQLRQKI